MHVQMLPVWEAFELRIGYRFKDRELLAMALTHRSFANESRDPAIADNERLEFLGDAVLDLVIGHLLFTARGDADEGELSRLRSDLVSASSLAGLAGDLAIGGCLLLGRGEARSGGRGKDNLLADSLEAVIGALFLDAGYDVVKTVLSRLFEPLLTCAAPSGDLDSKTRLQELLQARQQLRPEYLLTASRGPDHQRRYDVEVLVAGIVMGRGEGTTKKRAEQAAARHALERLAGEQGVADD